MKYSLSKILHDVGADLDVRSIYQMNQELFIILEHLEGPRLGDLPGKCFSHEGPFRLYRAPYNMDLMDSEQELFITSSNPLEVHYYLIESLETIERMKNHCLQTTLMINNTPVNFIECEDSINIPGDAQCLYSAPGFITNAECLTNTVIQGEREINHRRMFERCYMQNTMSTDIHQKMLRGNSGDKIHSDKYLLETNHQKLLAIVISLALFLMFKKCYSSFTNSSKLSLAKKCATEAHDDLEHHEPYSRSFR